jgi:hypothetical protein
MNAMRVVLAIASLVFTGCATVSTAPRAADRMGETVQPTRANTISNAGVIDQIHHGQSQDEVRIIMRHSPERTEVGSLTESWGYMTSDKNSMITWITFTDRIVSSLSHEVVARD